MKARETAPRETNCRALNVRGTDSGARADRKDEAKSIAFNGLIKRGKPNAGNASRGFIAVIVSLNSRGTVIYPPGLKTSQVRTEGK